MLVKLSTHTTERRLVANEVYVVYSDIICFGGLYEFGIHVPKNTFFYQNHDMKVIIGTLRLNIVFLSFFP